MSHLRYDDHYVEGRSSKAPAVITLAARVATFASLVVAIVILQTNKVTLKNGFRLTFSSYYQSYEYIFYLSILGVVYSLLQIPFAVYYLRAKKRLIQHSSIRHIDFYGDKIMSLLLGTGVGVAFGATRELKLAFKPTEDGAKMNDFSDMNYIAAVFILVGCFGCAINSIFSSLALSKGQ